MTYRMSVRDALQAMAQQRTRLETEYRASGRYTVDALEWVSHPATDLPYQFVVDIVAAYQQSAAYRTVIDDATNGEFAW